MSKIFKCQYCLKTLLTTADYPIIIFSLNIICIFSTCIPNKTIANGTSSTNIYNGLPFYNRSAWYSNNWRSDICSCDGFISYSMIPFDNPNRITIHHTYDPRQSVSLMDSKWKMRWIQSLHQDVNGWCDIGYHFLIDSIGNVFQGRPFWDDNDFVQPFEPDTYKWPQPRLIQGRHSLNQNENNIGISVIGCYDNRSCDEADLIQRFDQTYTTLIQLISFIADYYDISVTDTSIIRHRDIRDTNCPGSILSAMLEDIKLDVNNTLNGDGLCFDTNLQKNGVCVSRNECQNYVQNEGNVQCVGSQEQICCIHDIESDSKSGSSFEWELVVISILIVAIVVFIIVVVVVTCRNNSGYKLKEKSHKITASTELLSTTKENEL